MNKNLIFILLFAFAACKTHTHSKKFTSQDKLDILKSELNLSQIEYTTLRNDDSIINQAYKTLKYKVEKAKINSRLDSFFDKKYTRKQTYIALILEQTGRGLPFYFHITDEKNDNQETFTPDKERELRKFFVKHKESFEKSGGQWVTDTALVNSRRRNEPDSIYRIKLKKYIKREDSLRKVKMKLEDPERYYRLIEFNRIRDSLIRLKQKDSLN